MNPLDLLPLPYRLAIIGFLAMCAAAAIFAYGHSQHSKGLAQGKAEVTAKWNAERAKQAADALAQAQANAKETQRRIAAQQEAQHATDQEIERYKLAAAAAATERDRVLKRADQLAAAARRAASNPAASSVSQSASDAAGMLALMHRRTDAFAEVTSRYADALKRAITQCNRDYDALDAAFNRKP